MTIVLVLAGGGYASYAYIGPRLFQKSEISASYQTYRVVRGQLRITVTEDGNVESAANVDVKCQVEGGSQILSIVPEGTQVSKGTELVRLDSSLIEDQITQQKITYEKANSAFISADKAYEVSKIAVEQYRDGTFVQELQVADANIVIARENLKSSENTLEHSEKMFRKGYINQLQLEQNRFSVQRCQLELDNAMTVRKVLVEYTKPKTLTELESARDTAKGAMLAEKAAAELEKSKLDRLHEQLRRCTIIAPQDGMVIYANESGRRGNQQSVTIEEGAQVREYQSIILLPDLSHMQVKALVHETKIDKIRPGMKAIVRIRDSQTWGTVTNVASQPEAGSWFASSVKEYSTIVKIDDNSQISGLKPGMTAEVEIVIDELADVLFVPLLGVVEQAQKHFCYLATNGGHEKRPVIIGASNDKFIEIKDGLNEGDIVILNPRASIPDARTSQTRMPGLPMGTLEPRPASDSSGSPRSEKGKDAGSGGPTVKKGGPSGKQSRPNLMSYDANKDGKITKEELPEAMQPMMSFVDTNKDGAIDAKELDEARKRRPQGPPGGGRAGGAQGQGPTPSG